MARQSILYGLPIPVYGNETGTRQEIITGVYLNESAGAAAAALAATPTCLCTTVAGLTTQITLGASSTCICTLVADLSVIAPAALIASLSSLTTVTSALSTSITLASSATCLCTVGAVLTIGVPLFASLTVTPSVSVTATLFYVGSSGITYPPTSFPPVPHIFESDMNGVVWQRWLAGLSHKVRDEGQLLWKQLSFKASNLTNIETRLHNDLQQIQGGAAGDYYHVTLQQRDKIDVDEILLWLNF